MNSPDPEIRLSGLSKQFQEGARQHDVLRDITIDFQRGETVALRGRSGSGKSTLLNLISGIEIPDAGEIVIAGQNITRMSEHDRTLFRRQHIGFVYQSFNLVPTLTVSDNVRLVLELNGFENERASERIRKLLADVDLADRADSYPDVLSGGEQQRVALARAVAHEPSLLLADEPTGNLDQQTAQGVLKLLDELVRQSGGTMLIATHSTAIAESCDRVLELRNGKLSS